MFSPRRAQVDKRKQAEGIIRLCCSPARQPRVCVCAREMYIETRRDEGRGERNIGESYPLHFHHLDGPRTKIN